MGQLSDELHAFLDANPVGVLATLAPDGRPRQSLVYFARDADRLLISTLAERLKARDTGRTGWASLCVMGHAPPYPSATFAGSAQILTERIGPATAAIAQRMTGTAEPPEPMSDETLAAAGRVILAIDVEHVAAANYIASATEAGHG
jgi:PPOX class probable F420-dependent enzyme